ncbi:NTP transferase domain-containing protein [Streptomyces sodiiphilus]|uniref:NTP transferase domain-containing protein n=1 Tax=Streptomyces sodiiphilus TaxID=226217 RepID=A0ABP5AU86_9ACTN
MLAGGAARRLGGADKPSLRVGGRTLLDRVLAGCAGASRTVVVGPRRPTCRPVTWAREEPPGGGPLPALHAGLRHVTEPLVLVLAADLPFLGRETAGGLLELPAGAEAAVLTDTEGRDQPLTAAYRTEPLRRELALLAAEYGRLVGLPLRLLLPGLALHRVPAPAAADRNGAPVVMDCDTWAEVAAARARIREHGNVLDEWIAAVSSELGIDPEVDTTALLDAARDAAHGVTRPAAPLTTFLMGYAAARGLDPATAAARVSALAARWAEEGGAPGDTTAAGLPEQAQPSDPADPSGQAQGQRDEP